MIVEYRVKYWDENDKKINEERGFAGCGDDESFRNVVDKICVFFRPDMIESIQILPREDTLSFSEIEDIMNEEESQI